MPLPEPPDWRLARSVWSWALPAMSPVSGSICPVVSVAAGTAAAAAPCLRLYANQAIDPSDATPTVTTHLLETWPTPGSFTPPSAAIAGILAGIAVSFSRCHPDLPQFVG